MGIGGADRCLNPKPVLLPLPASSTVAPASLTRPQTHNIRIDASPIERRQVFIPVLFAGLPRMLNIKFVDVATGLFKVRAQGRTAVQN
jgi:hypothetical protein